MKPARRSRWSWTLGRWTWGVAAVVATQVLLVLVLSDRSPLQRRAPINEFHLRLIPTVGASPVFRELEALSDPTLFALPSRRGFVRAGGNPDFALGYQSPDWSEPLHWLSNRTTFPVPNLVPDSANADHPSRLDKPAPQVADAAPSGLPMPTATRLRAEGALAGRGVRALAPLPAIVYSNLLADTAVRVGVLPDGNVFSAAIARSSGLKAADDQALAIARTARFAPEPRGAGTNSAWVLTWGELVFRWQVATGTGAPRP